MKLFLTLLSSFLILSALAENAQSKALMAEDAIDHAARIVGGTEVTPHSFPFVVALIVDFGLLNLLCQGCIISNMMVLTTGKCIDNSISTQVIAGAHDITRIEPDQRRQTIFSHQYRIHPNYTTSWFHNDIALILLNDPIVPSEFIQIIALPELQPEPLLYAGELATIFGWFIAWDHFLLIKTIALNRFQPECWHTTRHAAFNSKCCLIKCWMLDYDGKCFAE